MSYGPGHDEEMEEYGARCIRCGAFVFDITYPGLCRTCAELREAQIREQELDDQG